MEAVDELELIGTPVFVGLACSVSGTGDGLPESSSKVTVLVIDRPAAAALVPRSELVRLPNETCPTSLSSVRLGVGGSSTPSVRGTATEAGVDATLLGMTVPSGSPLGWGLAEVGADGAVVDERSNVKD